jgi:predicted alpha/beta hydrolase family esterase
LATWLAVSTVKTVLILHGIGGHAGIHWQQWLHDELQKPGYEVLMPDLPDSDHPDRQAWLDAVKAALKNASLSDLIIVGHSLGITTALDFLEQADTSIDGLISVSGFADDYGAELNSYFLREKAIDFNKVNSNLKWSNVIYGGNDPYVTQSALKQVAEGLGVEPVIIPDGGHLNSEAGYTKLPVLLDIIKPKA